MERKLSTLSSRAAWLVTSLFLAGCSADPGARQAVADTTQTPAARSQATATTSEPATPQTEPPAPEAIRVVASTPAPKPAQVAAAHSSPVAAPPVEPAIVQSATAATATPKPTAKEATTPTVAPTKAAVATTADPGGVVEVKATKAGLTRIGAVKCKLCHQVQFASWTKTAHATRVPPLDCESCHGAGSEYKTLAIMKDAKKAQAAGMVNPEAAFCARCHTSGVTDDFLKKAHAHKAGA